MISISHKGDFNKTDKFLKKISSIKYMTILEKYAREGVRILQSATPVDSGTTARSWNYNITLKNNNATISWTNSNIVNGAPIAILLQYGHATGNGGYVQGRDYINPVMRPLFDKIANSVWKEVTEL